MRLPKVISTAAGMFALALATLTSGQSSQPPALGKRTALPVPSPSFFKETWRIDGPPRALAVDLEASMCCRIPLSN